MEPEQLAPYGYEVPDSKGFRDKLDTSANSTTTTSSTTIRSITSSLPMTQRVKLQLEQQQVQ
eukprot:2800774-Amphidinium_carterae.1